jgi:hypothetical protein
MDPRSPMIRKSHLWAYRRGAFRIGIRWPVGWRFPTTPEYMYASFTLGLLLGILIMLL